MTTRAPHCTMCRHPQDSHRIDPETGFRPCRSIGHPKGLNCTDCERLTSPEHIAAVVELRNSDDPTLTAALGAYMTTLDHVRREFGDAHQAFFTEIHESAVASALIEIRHSPQDAPTVPVQPATPATPATETTTGTGDATGELSALRERIASASANWAWSYPISSWCLGPEGHREKLAQIWGDQIADAVMDVIRPVLERLEQRAEDAEVRAEQAEAALAKHRDYLDRNFRQWCSPYGVAADYATKLIAQLDGLDRTAPDDLSALQLSPGSWRVRCTRCGRNPITAVDDTWIALDALQSLARDHVRQCTAAQDGQ